MKRLFIELLEGLGKVVRNGRVGVSCGEVKGERLFCFLIRIGRSF